jgi:FMN phosphatase YigB (HAD superfamily)
MSNHPYRAWLIDLDGTLYHAPAVRLAMALELACGHWSALRRLRVFRHEHERLRRNGDSPHADPYAAQIERAALRLGCSQDDLRTLVAKWMHDRPGRWIRRFRRRGLLEEIAAFRRLGGKTALVSDYPAAAKLKALAVGELFETVVACGEPDGPKRLKPWPDGYLQAAERLQVPPAACLVIGDRLDADGEAAARAGMAFRRV